MSKGTGKSATNAIIITFHKTKPGVKVPGHNPAGGAMVITMIVALAATSITGYMMTTDAYLGAKWVEEVHEVFANLTVGLVLLHVIGVLATTFQHRENLLKGMITGRKRAE